MCIVSRLIPSWPKRECIFIVGQQGAGPVSPFDHWDIRFFDHYWHAGKSWFAGRYIREWKKQHPDGRVIVFSQVGEDKELDKVSTNRNRSSGLRVPERGRVDRRSALGRSEGDGSSGSTPGADVLCSAASPA